ncbi:thioredoxin family protein [Flagellimonas sp.]|jgi:thiol-disulfide isomerase/thioredoxin|uniref:thioredoxin family protein n=1 Tax=Flagellimonas sp. TaxID=2058762 RepID=UPI003BAA23CA|tara:strand:+ start:78402 stop:79010 length:609 start_codon:yes stop_codon:yes gene_type:complete
MSQNVKNMIQGGIENGMDYIEYVTVLNELVSKGKTTGSEQSEQRIAHTKLNASRIRRIDKTVSIAEDQLKVFQNISEKQVWLVLLESWCSDGAQAIPVFNKVAKSTPKIELKIIMRDENPKLMDRFLTNGTRSIPKLLVSNEEGDLLHIWGPRPEVAAKMVEAYKEQYGKVDEKFKRELQIWYNKDGGKSIVDELIRMVSPL